MKRTSILFCLLFAITANSFTAAKAQVNTTDSLTLVDLYNSTNGPHWNHHTNWLTTKPVSAWYGVKVINNRVTKIYLGFNLLSGTLPSSIGNITNLQELILKGNFLNDTIPAGIGNLAKLTYLDLNGNELSGNIPTTIGKLANLTALMLESNRLSGTIPAELGNLKKVENLYLHFNLLSGTIPASLRKLTSAFIDLGYNLLSQFEQPHSALDTIDQAYSDIEHNRLTFDGMQVIAKYYPHVTYTPQDTILPIRQNGNTLSVSAGGTLSNNTYKWHRAETNDSTVIKADSAFTPSASGMYYVTVKNKAIKGLILYSDTINFVMPAAKQSHALIAQAIQPASVIKQMLVYPNPAKDLIHLQTTGTASIMVTNSAGKTLLTKTINNSADINVTAFANGTYYIQNKTTGEKEKFIIVH